jgi:hypothetical protein
MAGLLILPSLAGLLILPSLADLLILPSLADLLILPSLADLLVPPALLKNKREHNTVSARQSCSTTCQQPKSNFFSAFPPS